MLSLVSGSQAAFGLIYDELSVVTFAICRHHLSGAAAVDEAMAGLWLYIWQNAAMLSALEGSPWSIIIRTAEHHAEFHARTERMARASDAPRLDQLAASCACGDLSEFKLRET